MLRREARRLMAEATFLRLQAEIEQQYADKLEALCELEITDELLAKVWGQAEVDKLYGPSLPKPAALTPDATERMADEMIAALEAKPPRR